MNATLKTSCVSGLIVSSETPSLLNIKAETRMTLPPSSILFCGTPDFAVPILAGIHAAFPTQLAAVLTRTDAPSGRGQQLTPSPVRQFATSVGLHTVCADNKHDVADIINGLNPSLIIVVAYGVLFPKRIVDSYFCMNIHGSLLPKFRGASPIHSALLAGESTTGITLIKMVKEMDAGPILAKREISIAANDTFESLHNRLSELATSMTVDFIHRFADASILPMTDQDHNAATYCRKLTGSDFLLDPGIMSAVDMDRRIRTFSPTPGAYVIHQNKRIKVLECTIDHNKIIPTMVKPEGRGVMDYRSFLQGNPPLPF